MEFPELGKHCSEKSCKQLDFLPVKCDACGKIFCNDHFSYEVHNCIEAYKKNNQVPVCPLCNKPIPIPKGQTADQVVGQHIDADCQSDPAREKRGKIFSNKCSRKGCKQKELVPFKCECCHKNFCIKHRLETDHDCKGFQNSGTGMSRTGAAAVGRSSTPNNVPSASRNPPSRPQQANILTNIGRNLDSDRRDRQRALQGGISEDEAMARALAMSMNDSGGETSQDQSKKQQEDADAALARALQQSEQETRQRNRRANRGTSQSEKSSCQLS